MTKGTLELFIALGAILSAAIYSHGVLFWSAFASLAELDYVLLGLDANEYFIGGLVSYAAFLNDEPPTKWTWRILFGMTIALMFFSAWRASYSSRDGNKNTFKLFGFSIFDGFLACIIIIFYFVAGNNAQLQGERYFNDLLVGSERVNLSTVEYEIDGEKAISNMFKCGPVFCAFVENSEIMLKPISSFSYIRPIIEGHNKSSNADAVNSAGS